MDPSTQRREDDECPVCHNILPQDVGASEAHVATCIENQLFHVEDNKRNAAVPSSTGAQLFMVQGHQGNSRMTSSSAPIDAQLVVREEDQCPVCHTSLFSKAIGDSDSAREAHVMACLDAVESQPPDSVSNPDNLAPPYSNLPPATGTLPQQPENSLGFFSRAAPPLFPASDDKNAPGNANGKLMKGQEDRNASPLHSQFHTTDMHLRQSWRFERIVFLAGC